MSLQDRLLQSQQRYMEGADANSLAVRQSQHGEFDRFLEGLSTDDKCIARAGMLGYILGDVPPTIFQEAMDVLRKSFTPKPERTIEDRDDPDIHGY